MNIQSTAIICAYNEENTIENILKDVCSLKLFNEVIVINDGSQDKTSKLIKDLKKTIEIKDIHLQTNMGKGFAMALGVEMATCENLVFIDADLSNFTHEHALKLISPILAGDADMVLGQATETLIRARFNPFKNLSGQRALKKADILPILERMKTVRYGVETLINMQFNARSKTIEYVYLKNLIHPTKFQKTKPHKAIIEFVQEGFQIMTTFISHFILIKKGNKQQVSII